MPCLISSGERCRPKIARELGLADVGKRTASSSGGGRAPGIARGCAVGKFGGLGLSCGLAEADICRSQGPIFDATRSRACVKGRSVPLWGAMLLLLRC